MEWVIDIFPLFASAVAFFAMIYFTFEYFALKRELKGINIEEENNRLREECERLREIIERLKE